jgi:hypothetical protein
MAPLICPRPSGPTHHGLKQPSSTMLPHCSASPTGLALPRRQEPVVHTTGRGCTSPPGLEQPKRAPESNGFQAWKAGTPSLSILFRSPMLEQDRWRCRISRSRRPRTIHHRFLRRKRSPGRYAMNSSKDLIRTG